LKSSLGARCTSVPAWTTPRPLAADVSGAPVPQAGQNSRAKYQAWPQARQRWTTMPLPPCV